MRAMKTVIETPTFQKHVDDYWSSDERLQFIAWLAANPTAGVVAIQASVAAFALSITIRALMS